MPTTNLTQEITWNQYTGMLDTAPDNERNVLMATSLSEVIFTGGFDYDDECWRDFEGMGLKHDEVLYWAEMPTHPGAKGGDA